MKLCIPVESDKGLDSIIYGHFGSAPNFLVYNTDSEKVEAIINANQHHEHGTCNPAETVKSAGIDFAICKGMGARAIINLNEAGIKVLRTVSNTAKEAINDFKIDKLDILDLNDACNDHHCH